MENMAYDAIEYLSFHKMDPCNFFIGASPSSFMEGTLVSIEQLLENEKSVYSEVFFLFFFVFFLSFFYSLFLSLLSLSPLSLSHYPLPFSFFFKNFLPFRNSTKTRQSSPHSHQKKHSTNISIDGSLSPRIQTESSRKWTNFERIGLFGGLIMIFLVRLLRFVLMVCLKIIGFFFCFFFVFFLFFLFVFFCVFFWCEGGWGNGETIFLFFFFVGQKE